MMCPPAPTGLALVVELEGPAKDLENWWKIRSDLRLFYGPGISLNTNGCVSPTNEMGCYHISFGAAQDVFESGAILFRSG